MEWIDQLKPLITWIHLHPGWSGVITFLIAMSESLAVVGLIVPGSIIMSAIGTLVGAEIVPVVSTFIWAITGAITGDIISYHLGSKFNHRIPQMWPFRRYPHWLAKAQDFFHRHGRKSVFFGRFVGPMRPITPIVAGMMKMPVWRFYSASVIASTLWAPVYMLPGILIGAASQELEPATATRFLISVVVALIALWLSMWLIKWLLALVLRLLSYLINKLWIVIDKTPILSGFCHWLRDPSNPNSHSQFTIFLGWLVITGLSLWAALSTLHQGIITILNQPTHQLLLNIHESFATHVFVGITLLSAHGVLVTAMFVSFIWLLFNKHWQIAWHWLLGPVLVAGVVGLSNVLIFYPRPSGLVQIITGNSFPSSQAALTIALYGFFGVIITRPMTIPLRRQMIYYSLITLCSLIIFSRLYLGIHWITDVIAGVLCGIWVLLLVTLSFRRHVIYPLATGKFCAIFLVTLTLAWSVQMLQNYRDYIANFTPFWPTYHITQNNWWDQSTTSQPLYRSNRLGKPVQIMNVQWLGNLPDITAALKKHGWQIQPKPGIISTINNLSSHDKQKKTPLLQPLYLGQKPLLVATKQATGMKQMVLLQLWPSKITLTDNMTPLWIGTIEYQSPHPHKFWQSHYYQAKFVDLPSPIDELMIFTKSYHTKIVYYPPSHRPPTIPAYQWDGGVIFIKPVK